MEIWIFDAEKSATQIDSTPKKEPSYSKNDFTHWGGLDFGVSMLTTIDNKFILSDEVDTTQMNTFLDLNYSKSLHFSLNLIEQNIRIYKNYVILETGMGMEWNSYNFNKNITLDADAPYISASNTAVAPDSIKFSKNKLKVTYLKVPLIFEFNTNNKNPNRSFHISGGFEFAYKIGSRTKQKYEINGYDYKTTRRDDYHLADFKYSTVFRVGYGDYFTVFANYGLSNLFEYKKGPNVYPLTAGITIGF